MGTRMCTIQAVPSRTTRLHARAVPWGILILERCPHFSGVTRYVYIEPSSLYIAFMRGVGI